MKIDQSGTLYLSRIAMLCLFAGVVSGCEKWPPYHEEVQERFDNSREAFEALEKRISKSDYDHVSPTGIYGIPKFNESDSVVAYRDTPDGRESEFIEDDPEWSNLLVSANVFGVGRDEDTVSFTFIGPVEERGRMVFLEIVHSAERREPLKLCLQEHKDLECGICAYDLDDAWFIQYHWSPEELVPDGIDALVDGEMTQEEYDEAFDERLQSCRKAGYQAIGYDLSDWQGDAAK